MMYHICHKTLFRLLLIIVVNVSSCMFQNMIFTDIASGREELVNEQAADPAYFVRELVKACSNIIHLNKDGDYADLLGKFLNQNMSYHAVGSFLFGRHWHDLDDAKRNQLTQALGPFIVNKYLVYLQDVLNNQHKIEIVDSVYRASLKDYLVRTSVKMNDSKNLTVSWRIFLDAETQKYKVSDIIVYRVSLLLTIRTLLLNYINDNGIEQTIDLITKRQSIP